MRVLHLTDGYLPRVGGIELHVRDLATRQRLLGVDARVVTLTPVGDEPDPTWVHRIGGLQDGGTPSLRRAAVHLERVLSPGSTDVVHVHLSVLSPFGILAARQAAARGLPTVVTVHSMWSRLGPAPAVARDLLGLRRWPLTWSAVSDRAAEPVRDLLGPGTPVAVLPNAVEPDGWRGVVPTWPRNVPTRLP